METHAPRQLFLSHNTEGHAALAAYLTDHIEHLGVRVWIAPRDIPKASPWDSAIAAGLEASDAFVVLLDSQVPSGWVETEISMATARMVNKTLSVLPVTVAPEPLIPSFLRTLQVVDLAADFQRGLSAICEHLGILDRHRAYESELLSDWRGVLDTLEREVQQAGDRAALVAESLQAAEEELASKRSTHAMIREEIAKQLRTLAKTQERARTQEADAKQLEARSQELLGEIDALGLRAREIERIHRRAREEAEPLSDRLSALSESYRSAAARGPFGGPSSSISAQFADAATRSEFDRRSDDEWLGGYENRCRFSVAVLQAIESSSDNADIAREVFALFSRADRAAGPNGNFPAREITKELDVLASELRARVVQFSHRRLTASALDDDGPSRTLEVELRVVLRTFTQALVDPKAGAAPSAPHVDEPVVRAMSDGAKEMSIVLRGRDGSMPEEEAIRALRRLFEALGQEDPGYVGARKMLRRADGPVSLGTADAERAVYLIKSVGHGLALELA